MVRLSENEILAAATELRGLLRDAGVRGLARNLRQRRESARASLSLLPVHGVLHGPARAVAAGRYPEQKRAAGNPTFNQFDNPYDVAAYNRLCTEFGIDPASDFRFKRGMNHGLGNIYRHMNDTGEVEKTDWAHFFEWHKFSDTNISHIEPEPIAATQYDWFASKTVAGLTQVGLSRINQSIEAFVYCILGAQVNVRSSILGQGSRAKEARTEFLTLMEDAIRQPNLSQSVQRYQLAVDEAKVRLNLAVAPLAWLMLARMIINTESTVGYNNKLKQAVAGMKLGANNEVNPGTEKAGLKTMEGGPSKINPPNGHPSNPIHKAAESRNQAF